MTYVLVGWGDMSRVVQWGQVWVALTCVGLVALGVLLWPERESVLRGGMGDWVVPRVVGAAVVAAVLASIVVLVSGVRGSRNGKREILERKLRKAVADVVDYPRGHTVVRKWRGLVPQRVVIELSREFWEQRQDSSRVAGRVARVVGEQVEGSAKYAGVRRRQNIVVKPRSDGELVEDARDEVRDRVRKVMMQTVPKAKRVSVKEWDEGSNPTRIVVTYEPTPRISALSIEEAILRVVGNSFPGRWRSVWDRENDLVTFEVRPGLPTLARRPRDLPRLGHVELRYAVDENGQPHSWSWGKGQPPHALVMGETGGGKTYCLRAMALDAIAQGVSVSGADPKRIELMGLRGLPGVEEIATSPEAIVDLIESFFALMNERYELIESRQRREGSFNPHLVVLDEFFILYMRVNQMWHEDGGKGKEHPVFNRLWQLLALARSADIHFVIGIQRPDVNFMPGAARDNVLHRVSMRSLSEDGARMVWRDASVGRDVPNVPGRATAGRPGDAREVQIYLVPDPDLELRGDRSEEELTELAEIFAGAVEAGSDSEETHRAPVVAIADRELEPVVSAPDLEPVALEKSELELDGGHTVSDESSAADLVLVPAESMVAGDELSIEGDVVTLTEVGVDPGDEDYVMLEWSGGTLSVPGAEKMGRVA